MQRISRQLFFIITLLFSLSSQGEQDGKRGAQESSAVRSYPSAETHRPEIDRYENREVKRNNLEFGQMSNRYGIGYEARQDNNLVNQIDRSLEH
jgi:hypothetical protein